MVGLAGVKKMSLTTSQPESGLGMILGELVNPKT
jgi:hypothetical protein